MVATKLPIHKDIQKALIDKGEDWVIAALVHISIGYFDPHSARRTLKQYLDGDKENWCERCLALYGSNAEKMIISDISAFEYYEKNCQESFKKTMEYIAAWSKMPEEPFGGITSLAYPTAAP